LKSIYLQITPFFSYENIQNSSISYQIYKFLGSFGHQSVMIFFVISGFLISKSAISSLSNNMFKIYLSNRLVRLYIVLIPALFITYILDYININYFGEYLGESTLQMIVDRTNIETFIGNSLFLQEIFFSRFGSNGPLWSLAYEFWYYIIFPLSIIFFYKKTILQKIISLLLLLIILITLPMVILKFFIVWLIGVSIWFIKEPLIKNPLIPFLLFLIILIISTLELFQKFPFGIIMTLSIAISFALVLNSLRFYDRYIFTIKFFNSVANFLSDISFSLYLNHFPLILLLNSYLIFINENIYNVNSFYLGLIYLLILVIVLFFVNFMYLFTEKHTFKVQKVMKNILLKKKVFND